MSGGIQSMGTTWSHDGRPLTELDVRVMSKAFAEQTQYVKVLEGSGEALLELAKKLATKVETLQAEAEKARDERHSDTNLLNYLQWMFQNHGVSVHSKFLYKWNGMTDVRKELAKERDTYNGVIKILRNKKGDPI